MRTISKKELEQILENHRRWYTRWIKDETNTLDRMRACLLEVDLSGMDLSGADLRFAILNGVNLRGANLRNADLSDANLYGSYLIEANLSEADLSGANLCMADLHDTILSGAMFYEANLYKAILPDPKIMNSICPLACPERGAFIGWKKAEVILPDESGFMRRVEVIVELQIPGRAKRSSATGRKCRCNEAEVLDILSPNRVSLPNGTIAHSQHDPTFTYKVGQKLYIEDFDDDRWKECSTGIHFFITRQEAIDY